MAARPRPYSRPDAPAKDHLPFIDAGALAPILGQPPAMVRPALTGLLQDGLAA